MLQFTTKLNDLIWSKPMLFLILGAGIFFTVATSDFGMIRLTLYFGVPPLMDFGSHTFA